eukprot:gene9598-11368_t
MSVDTLLPDWQQKDSRQRETPWLSAQPGGGLRISESRTSSTANESRRRLPLLGTLEADKELTVGAVRSVTPMVITLKLLSVVVIFPSAKVSPSQYSVHSVDVVLAACIEGKSHRLVTRRVC